MSAQAQKFEILEKKLSLGVRSPWSQTCQIKVYKDMDLVQYFFWPQYVCFNM